MPAPPFSDLSAVERAAALADAGSLQIDAAPGPGRSTLLIGRARIGGRAVRLGLSDGRVRGGTIGTVEARQLSELAAAAEAQRSALVMGWDTGGVRVQGGPAALAAASAVGVALTRLALSGVPVVHLISGRRGCFGAPSVIAATGSRTLLVDGAAWGLTGPALLEGPARPAAARAAMAAAHRRAAGHADDDAADRAASVRRALARALRARPQRLGLAALLDRSLAVSAALLAQRSRPPDAAGEAPPASDPVRSSGRRRDFFAYSFRRQWEPLGPTVRLGHVHAAWGRLAGAPAMGIIVGPERSPRGVGIADVDAVVRALRRAAAAAPGAPVVTFLFCRGHASDLAEERAGLPRALAECLRAMVAMRLAGHPLVCVLGGGAYGAAYLALAAPSHRVLAIRGTALAPMTPRLLARFRRLRGLRSAPATPPALAELIPDIRIVESVVRLPAALRDELAAARRAVAATAPRRLLTVPPPAARLRASRRSGGRGRLG